MSCNYKFLTNIKEIYFFFLKRLNTFTNIQKKEGDKNFKSQQFLFELINATIKNYINIEKFITFCKQAKV